MPQSTAEPEKPATSVSDRARCLAPMVFAQCWHWCDGGVRTAAIAVLCENLILSIVGLFSANIFHIDETYGTMQIFVGIVGVVTAAVILALSSEEGIRTSSTIIKLSLGVLFLMSVWWIISVCNQFSSIHALTTVGSSATAATTERVAAVKLYTSNLSTAMHVVAQEPAEVAFSRELPRVAAMQDEAPPPTSSPPPPPADGGASASTPNVLDWTLACYEATLIIAQSATTLNHMLLAYLLSKDLGALEAREAAAAAAGGGGGVTESVPLKSAKGVAASGTKP